MFSIAVRTLFAAAVIASMPLVATIASAQGYYPHAYYQDPYAAQMQAEHEHMARERHHLRHERQARDHALSHGDYWGAWAVQQHMNQERHHLWHEQQEHINR